MGDALVLHHYLEWSGVGPTDQNRLGFTVQERAMVRVLKALDWLEARLDPDGFQPGRISVQDIALACLILWAESRWPIQWRGRPHMESLLARLERRDSFRATVPRPHALRPLK
jgi:glutathione S-transferase